MRSVHILGLGLLVGMTALGVMLATVAYRWQEATFPREQETGAQTAQTPGAPTGGTPGAAAKPGAAPAPGGDASAGQAVFQQNCTGCHPGGNQGAGPALRGKNLPADLVSTTVRQGRGAMPAFSPGQINDQQLASLAAYVSGLR